MTFKHSIKAETVLEQKRRPIKGVFFVPVQI